MNDEQVENWRMALTKTHGAAALLFSKEAIIKMRDRVQAEIYEKVCTCDPATNGYTKKTDGIIVCNNCRNLRTAGENHDRGE